MGATEKHSTSDCLQGHKTASLPAYPGSTSALPTTLLSPIPRGDQPTCREVVRLCCEDNMPQLLLLLEAAWLRGVLRLQESDFLPLDCTVDTSVWTLLPSWHLCQPSQHLGPALSQP